MFGFILGREYKLSIAEILAVFPSGKLVAFDKEFLILEGIDKAEILKKADNLGGTIKIVEIGDFDISQDAKKYEGKFRYGINVFGHKKNLKDILNQTKKSLKNAGISSRFVNKDFKNLISAQIIGEKLVNKNSDYNYIFFQTPSNLPLIKGGKDQTLPFDKGELKGVFGKTIWIQNIGAYSKRDFGKERDMKTGMLPPKLAQMMINIGNRDLCHLNSHPNPLSTERWNRANPPHGGQNLQDFGEGFAKQNSNAMNKSIGNDVGPRRGKKADEVSKGEFGGGSIVKDSASSAEGHNLEKKSIFDPFVGLGTILIEAGLMGFKELYGSDLNEKMVEYSQKNLKEFLKNKEDSCVKHENDIFIYKFEKLNAKFIEESKFLDKADLIVSEGYLGEMMTKKNISLDRINRQKESLKSLYEKFFIGLKKVHFPGNIVISFPFRELNGKYVYVNEVYELLEKYCIIEKLFPEGLEDLPTRMGSLLYKRENQLVGREIFKLRIKI